MNKEEVVRKISEASEKQILDGPVVSHELLSTWKHIQTIENKDFKFPEYRIYMTNDDKYIIIREDRTIVNLGVRFDFEPQGYKAKGKDTYSEISPTGKKIKKNETNWIESFWDTVVLDSIRKNSFSGLQLIGLNNKYVILLDESYNGKWKSKYQLINCSDLVVDKI